MGMRFRKDMLLLYAVTEGSGEVLRVKVEKALKGGVTMVQLREKYLSDEELLNEAIYLKRLCREYSVPLIINDRYDIAIKAGADGVHLGQADADPAEVRRLTGEDFIIGVSAHSIAEARKAKEDGADYLGVGAVFGTFTKADARPLPMEMFKEICEVSDIPVAAIGGVNKENVPQLKGSGASGAAMISAIFGAEDIEKECRELKMIISETLDPLHEKSVNPVSSSRPDPFSAETLDPVAEAASNAALVKTSNQVSAAGFSIGGHTVKGAIFDFDGTIADSMPAWSIAGYEYLEAQGALPDPGLEKTLFTMTLEQSADFFRKNYNVIRTPKEILDGIYSVMETHYLSDVRPKTGVAELLNKLQKAGVKMCVATMTTRRLVYAALKKWDMLRYFEEIFSADDMKCDKHTPVVYRAAYELLGTTKEETLVFEDALHAARTAKNDGFLLAAVMDPSEEHQKELREIADIYITDFEEIN